MDISAAIIVKNEESNLPRCIESIRKICKQIVIVDTGSDDRTPIIAANYGVDLYFKQWSNDFSEARNFALKHCYMDWILYIDADEELVIDDRLLNFLSIDFPADAGGILVNINNFLDADLTTSKKHRFTRIFRNDKNIRFLGKIHEQIADSILRNGYKIFDSNITINHYGYVGKNVDKELRNKELLLENQSSADVYNKYHLAKTYFSMADFDNALNIYKTINNSMELSEEQIEDVKIKTAQIYLKKNMFDEVINTLNFVSKDIDFEGLRLSILGATYLNTQNFLKAKEYYSYPAVSNSNLVNPLILENVKKVFNMLHIV